uniref:Uncharacterized protein n=1 Tax=Glossina brevipalpis TaxID=37001 RepID=A0A1A9WFJ4_9MUSC
MSAAELAGILVLSYAHIDRKIKPTFFKCGSPQNRKLIFISYRWSWYSFFPASLTIIFAATAYNIHRNDEDNDGDVDVDVRINQSNRCKRLPYNCKNLSVTVAKPDFLSNGLRTK